MAEQVCVCPQCGKKYKLKEEFDAKSFSCKGCGATVWVGGKAPTPAPTSRRSPAAPAARKGGRATAAASRKGGGRRSRGRDAPEQEEEGGRRGRGREKPKSSTNILIAVGALAVIGIVVVVAVTSGKKDKGGQPVATQPGGTTDKPGLAAAGTGAGQVPAAPVTNPPAAGTPAGTAAGSTPGTTPTTPEGTPTDTPGGDGTAPSPEGGEKPTKLGGDKKTPDGRGQHDPPATLGHLETTPPELRKQIDELVAILLDPLAGREVHESKAKLAAIGKPAFLPVLGGMAKIRDTLADDDSLEERRIESSLMLADQCLREMDGYLDAHDKGVIRPGTDNKYIKYILILHYRRWMGNLDGSMGLKDMPEMPGPFDPTKSAKESDPDDPDDPGGGRRGK